MGSARPWRAEKRPRYVGQVVLDLLALTCSSAAHCADTAVLARSGAASDAASTDVDVVSAPVSVSDLGI